MDFEIMGMGKLEPIERVIKAPEHAQILRCAVCGRPLDYKSRHMQVHATCKEPVPPARQEDQS